MNVKRVSRAFLAGLLIVSIFALIHSAPPARGYTNTQLWATTGNPSCSSTTLILSLSETVTANDPIVFGFGQLLTTGFIVSITDNLGDYWTVGTRLAPAGYGIDSEIWYTPSAYSGSLTSMTITFNTSPSSCFYVMAQYDTGPASLTSNVGNGYSTFTYPTITDIQSGVTSQAAGTLNIGWGFATVAYNSGSYVSLALSAAYVTSGSIGLSGLTGGVLGYFFCTTGCTNQQYVAAYSNYNGLTAYGTFPTISLQTGQTISIPSTTQTFGCNSHNSTAMAGTQNDIYYVEAQAPPYGATVINATAFLNDIATASVTMELSVYVAVQPSNPTPGFGPQAFNLQSSYSQTVATTSGNVKFFYVPSVAIPGSTYYIIALAQTDTGSGSFKLLEGGTGTWYKTSALASGGMPSTLNLAGVSSTSHSPCIQGQAQLTPLTISVISATTITGTTTATTTVTSIGQTQLITGNVNFSILLMLILGPAILFGGVAGAITKSGAAFLGAAAGGLAVGAALGNAVSLVPPLVVGVCILVAVVMGLVAFLAMGGDG